MGINQIFNVFMFSEQKKNLKNKNQTAILLKALLEKQARITIIGTFNARFYFVFLIKIDV